MIKKLSIQNYQSHRDTELEFHPGVNAIIGESDQGKSAIFRSLWWLYKNRPVGLNDASFWIRERDKLIDEFSATIETEKGIITRVRSGDRNSYLLPTQVFDAIGTDVPTQVEEFLNFSEVNIAEQHAPHFLLSQSGPDIARFLNRVVRIDIIDTVLSNIDMTKRAVSKDIKQHTSTIESLRKEIDTYQWVDKAQQLSTQYRTIWNQIQEIEVAGGLLDAQAEELEKEIKKIVNLPFDAIVSAIETWKELQQKIASITTNMAIFEQEANQIEEYMKQKNSVQSETALTLCAQYEGINTQIKEKEKDIKVLDEEAELLYGYVKIQHDSRKLPEIQALIHNYQQGIIRLENLQTMEDSLLSDINTIKDYLDIQNENNKEIQALQNELPNVCPTCGQILIIGEEHETTNL